jgi:hypothetical protein
VLERWPLQRVVVGVNDVLSPNLDEDEPVAAQGVEQTVKLGLVGEVDAQGGPDLVIHDRHAREVLEETGGNGPDNPNLVGDSRHGISIRQRLVSASNLPPSAVARVTRRG